jgi:type II secretory pathway component PulM
MAEPIAPLNREAIDASLLRRQLKAQSLTMSEDSVRIQLNAARYANVMEWMLEVQKAMRLYVDDVKFTGQTEVGQVNVVISLKQHRKTN